MSYIVSWSGGKDSCLACYETIRQGLQVSHLVNFISREYQRVNFHGTESRLIQLQSYSLRISLVQQETSWDDYEPAFKEAVRSIIPEGVEGMVFGDIYLEEHKQWVERVCGELGIKALEPLWGKSAEEILTTFINSGFEAVVVSAQADLIGPEWIGELVSPAFMDYLKSRNIDLCGENGEYHTLVIGGPIFKEKIRLLKTNKILRDNRWFLDTVSYRLEA
jgi:diphthine-ammonia ligase